MVLVTIEYRPLPLNSILPMVPPALIILAILPMMPRPRPISRPVVERRYPVPLRAAEEMQAENRDRAMTTRQKAVIGVGLAVVIAMALYPPWATWCIPVDDRDLQVQYGWLFGRLNYPDCAEKLPWAWGLATDRLLLQCGLVILATVALTGAFQSKDTG